MSSASTAVLIACALYLFIVVGTNRGFIVAPRARMLLAQAGHCDATATILAGRANPDTAATTAAAADAIKKSLKPILTRSRWRWLNPLAWIAGFPLTKVAQYTATVTAAEADLIDLVPDDDIDAWWATTHHHLRTLDPDAAKTLADAYAASPPQTPGAKRVFIRRAQAVIDDTAATALSLEFDRQRVAFWLASVGLVAVAGIGLALGHELTMLIGALGGFLAPVVTTLTSKRTSVWGVMVLSPVGGALTAIGGLILVFLMASDPLKILGPAFATYWQNPTDPAALGVALLFGFSGRLFSRLAISAASQIGSDQPTSPDSPATGGNKLQTRQTASE